MLWTGFSDSFLFKCFYFTRRGKGFFRHRLAALQEWEGSNDPLGQKYRFRETDLRLNREKGNSTPSPFLPVSNPGNSSWLYNFFSPVNFTIWRFWSYFWPRYDFQASSYLLFFYYYSQLYFYPFAFSLSLCLSPSLSLLCEEFPADEKKRPCSKQQDDKDQEVEEGGASQADWEDATQPHHIVSFQPEGPKCLLVQSQRRLPPEL